MNDKKCDTDEKHIDRCPCSTGDYTELFSNKESSKRTDLRMGIIYFFVIILSSITDIIAYTFMIIPIFVSTYYLIIKKDKNMSLRVLAIILFAIFAYYFKRGV